MHLETKNLIIRDFKMSDAEDYYEVAKDERVGPNCNWDVHPSVQYTKKVIKMYRKHKDTFAICLKTGEVIGNVQLYKDKSRVDTYEIGYCIHPIYWNNGFATEVCKKIIDYYFTFVNCHTVTALVKDDNLASIRVLEKNGFVKEGTLYSARKDIKARYIDCVSYSLVNKK